MNYDAGTYGRSFADVYDDWYPADDVADLVRWINTRWVRATILELGVGTGQIALALAAAGHRVTGIDSSSEMLELLAANDPGADVTAILGDVAAPNALPAGPFDVVVATNNLLMNLADRDAQRRCLQSIATVLAPNGRALIDGVVGATTHEHRRGLETRRVAADRVVLIATESDAGDNSIRGNHIEITNDGTRLRPWRLLPIEPAALDAECAAVGLELESRFSAFDDPTWDDAHASRHVSVYQRQSPG